MCVQVDGKTNLLLKCGYKLLCCIGLEKTGHILDTQCMSTASFKFLRKIYVVLKCVLVTFGIKDITCVADGCLKQLALIENFIHSNRHTGEPVKGVEYSENIDTGLCRLLDKLTYHIVREA